MNDITGAIDKAKGSAEEITNTINDVNNAVDKVNQTKDSILATKDAYSSKALEFIGMHEWSFDALGQALSSNPINTSISLLVVIVVLSAFFTVLGFIKKWVGRLLLLGVGLIAFFYFFM